MLRSLIYSLALASTCLATEITFDWNIGWVTAAPDGVYRQVIGINGQWPLPTIEGTVGDTVTIRVTNNLGSQSTGLHFHGINQVDSQVMDGPSGVTQCPIPPGSQFVYSFTVSQIPDFGRRGLFAKSLMLQALTGIILTMVANIRTV